MAAGFFKAVIVYVILDACCELPISVATLYSHCKSISSLLSGPTNQALFAFRPEYLPHACSRNGVHDMTCKTTQRWIGSRDSAGGGTVGASPTIIILPAQ